MRKYDYNFLKNESIPSQTTNLLNTLEAKFGKFKLLKYKYQTIFNELTKISIIQSVQSSNAIEGIVTTDKRIKELIENKVVPKNRDEREILGYKEALNEIHLNHEQIEPNINEILKLHKLLLSYTNLQYSGGFKTTENAIIEIDQRGMRKIRFMPVSAKETPQSMEQAYLAFLEAFNDSNINQLLLIPCFILDFLCIHPFSDGNGRISRLLTTLLLYKTGYNFVSFVSFENKIKLYKNDYYDALKYSSIDWHENSNDYYYFVDNFLITLIRTLTEVENRFNIFREKTLTKEERIKETILSSIKPLSKKELFTLWPDISISTLDKVLIKLQKEGIIKKVGQFKNAKYIKNN